MEYMKKLGVITSGSLTQGLSVKLIHAAAVEDLAVGRYLTVQGDKKRFFCMLTDISLMVTDMRLMQSPPTDRSSFEARVLTDTQAYAQAQISPYLTRDGQGQIEPVKTVPPHFAAVLEATNEDIESIFGKEDIKNSIFNIGNPLDMEVKLNLNLKAFAERSNGIFGKSGTGKTFLTRIMLSGLVQSGHCSNLVFDMHNEYGWEGVSEKDGQKSKVKGLKQLFPHKVSIFTLDINSSKNRGVPVDKEVKINSQYITAADIALLRGPFNLSDLAVTAAFQLEDRLGKNWIEQTLCLDDQIKNTECDASLSPLTEFNIHQGTFGNLIRGLKDIMRLGFIDNKSQADSVKDILDVIQNGKSVVLEFGGYHDTKSYLLVANLLSRRIYERYQKQMEAHFGDQNKPEPQPLCITIEEAHSFLTPALASQTIFGKIAREMRKYNASLLIIDQRPSEIDDEIMSQLGTRISCLLNDEKDVESVLSGMSGKSELKKVLFRLSSRQQALIFGHAVPMPIAFAPRTYNQDFYATMQDKQKPALDMGADGLADDLFN